MLNIVIQNKTKAKVSKSFLKKIARQTVGALKVKKNFEVSLFLVGENKMKLLNKQYRGQNCVSDVLAFSQLESKEHFILPKTSVLSLGDVIICYPQAKRQAKKYRHSVFTEIAILFIHGLIHLLGINHEVGPRQAKRMMELEEKVIKKLKLLK